MYKILLQSLVSKKIRTRLPALAGVGPSIGLADLEPLLCGGDFLAWEELGAWWQMTALRLAQPLFANSGHTLGHMGGVGIEGCALTAGSLQGFVPYEFLAHPCSTGKPH